MSGLLTNPVLEGLLMMVLGIVMVVVPETSGQLKTLGFTVIGAGMGYITHSSVQASDQAKK